MGILHWFRRKPPNFDSLVATLESGSEAERRKALETVRRAGLDVIQPLLFGLFSATEETAVWFARAIHQFGNTGLVFLIETLKHPGYEARISALYALDALGPDAETATPDAIRALAGC